MGNRMPGFMSGQEMATGIDRLNDMLSYSKRLEPFKPTDIEMLVSLSEIEPRVLDFEDCDIPKGTVCQMCATPSNVMVGYFGESGSGKSYYHVEDPAKFAEGEHFRVV